MRKLFGPAIAAFFAASVVAFAQHYPPPPAPGYQYSIPYGGFPAYAGVATSALQTAGDAYCIQGSSNKNIRITKIGISAVATAAIVVQASVILRSTADTGAGNAITAVTYDTTNPAATAVIKSYDTAPTPGTAIGTVRGVKLAVGTPGNTITIGSTLFQFTPSPLLLRGTSQFACVNFSAVGAGASIVVESEHQETTQSTN
jgi:hypothetical protein